MDPLIFPWYISPSYQDETESALPDGARVADKGGDEEQEAEAESGPAQLAQEAGPEVVTDGLPGLRADLKPLPGDDVEHEVPHVLRHGDQQHSHQDQQERDHLRIRTGKYNCFVVLNVESCFKVRSIHLKVQSKPL